MSNTIHNLELIKKEKKVISEGNSIIKSDLQSAKHFIDELAKDAGDSKAVKAMFARAAVGIEVCETEYRKIVDAVDETNRLFREYNNATGVEGDVSLEA